MKIACRVYGEIVRNNHAMACSWCVYAALRRVAPGVFARACL